VTRIVVGGDGSVGGAGALRWAHRLARARRARLEVLHAWEYPAAAALPGGPVPAADADVMDERVRAATRAWVDEVLGPDGPAVGVRVARGPSGSALAERGAAPDTEMLVVGTRGLGDVSRVILGSTSRRALELAAVPVVIVPEGAPPPESRHPIVVGVDGSVASERAVELATTLARSIGCAVIAAHAAELTHPELHPDPVGRANGAPGIPVEDWLAPLRLADVAHRAVVADGDPRVVLPMVAEAEDAWAVVVGRRGVGPLTRVLVGSVTNHLAAHIDRALVVVPPPAEPELG